MHFAILGQTDSNITRDGIRDRYFAVYATGKWKKERKVKNCEY